MLQEVSFLPGARSQLLGVCQVQGASCQVPVVRCLSGAKFSSELIPSLHTFGRSSLLSLSWIDGMLQSRSEGKVAILFKRLFSHFLRLVLLPHLKVPDSIERHLARPTLSRQMRCSSPQWKYQHYRCQADSRIKMIQMIEKALRFR